MKLKTLLITVLCVVFLLPAITFAVGDDTDQTAETTPKTTAEDQQDEQTDTDAGDAEQAVEDDSDEAEDEAYKFFIYVNDLSNYGLENKELSASYEIYSPLNIADVIEFHAKEILAPNGYKIAVNGLGSKWIEIDGNAAYIFAHPYRKEVQVIHYLTDCNGNVDATFLEKIEVDFLVDLKAENEAEKIALTRIEKMNDKGYSYAETHVDTFDQLPHGVKVYNIDGEEVTPRPELPTIHVLYKRNDCDKEAIENEEQADGESKVDAATLPADEEYNNVLPATGAQDLTAFLMSATVLIGLGIFLARKH